MGLRQSDIQLLDDLHALRRLEGVIDRMDRLEEQQASQRSPLIGRLSRALAVSKIGRPTAAPP